MTVQAFGVYDMLQRSAIAYGGRPAIIFEGGSSTFREFLARVDALATGLAGHALGKGERVCILAQNHPAYLELYGACAKLGLLAYPINWRLTARVPRSAPNVAFAQTAGGDPVKGQRNAYFAELGGFVECPVYDRYRFGAGRRVAGPALIEERESTIVVGPSADAEADELGNLLISVGTSRGR